MKRLISASVIAAVALAACGGGGDSTPPLTPSVKHITFVGNPATIVASNAVAKAAMRDAVDPASGTDPASAPGGASAPDPASSPVVTPPTGNEAAQALQDALTAAGVNASVTANVLTATQLHALVVAQDSGKPYDPTTNPQPTQWAVVSLMLDDMTTTYDSNPTQRQADLDAFAADLGTYINQMHAAGTWTYVARPISTCEMPTQLTMSAHLSTTIGEVVVAHGANAIAGVDPSAFPAITDWNSHMGADCMTPDATILGLQTTAIANDIAARLAVSQ